MDEFPNTTVVAALAFPAGMVLGATARWAQFCTLGAILGGLCFGFGMALVGTCSFGSLIRLGGGDLKSLVNFMVLGFVAYMTMRGLTVASGWLITGVIGADDFEPTPLGSFSFARPAGESLVYLMTFTGATINFGIAAVGGVFVGAFLAAAAKRALRLEAFDDGREMRRHLIGAALMGFGGVTALGCTIGQDITGLSTLSIGALLALAAILLGAYLGLRYLVEGSLLHALQSVIARH